MLLIRFNPFAYHLQQNDGRGDFLLTVLAERGFGEIPAQRDDFGDVIEIHFASFVQRPEATLLMNARAAARTAQAPFSQDTDCSIREIRWDSLRISMSSPSMRPRQRRMSR